MQLQLSPFLVPLILSAAIAAGLMIFALRHHNAPAAQPVSVLLFEMTLWIILYTLEFASPLPEEKRAWARLGYLILVSIPPTWLFFAMQYTRRGKGVRTVYQAAIFMIPALTLAVAATNSMHGMLWTEGAWNGDYTSLVSPLWFWVHLIFSYGVLIAGYGLLLYRYTRSQKPYRNQYLYVLSGGIIPFLVNFFYVFAPSKAASLSPLPILFALSALGCAAILLRFRNMDLVPVAHDMVIKSLSDGLLTIDLSFRILEINPAAEHILGLAAEDAIGQVGNDVLGDWFDRTVVHPRKQTNPEEVSLGRGVDQRQYDVMVSPLIDRRGEHSGSLVILRDITRRKRMETAEREQRFLAEALRDTAAALNSTLEITEVLDSILGNVERVVPHRAASIMLIEAGIARVARGRGYKEMGIWDLIKSVKFRVADMPNLRWMVETGQPYVLDDTRGATDWVIYPETSWIRSNVCAPIIIKGKTSGFINLDSDIPRFFDAVHAERLQAFANQSAVALENARLYRELQQLASTDELTSLFNRRRFFELGHNEVERSLRFGHPLTLMIMDADYFKQINDTYGHMVGDQVLNAVARRCRANLRNIDIVARYGGDEFVFLLLESDEAAALPAAQRILTAITETPFDTDSGPVAMTVSMGMAQVSEYAPDLTTLIKHADQALYRAKQTGRNMICTWEYRPGVEQGSNTASSTRPVQRPFGV